MEKQNKRLDSHDSAMIKVFQNFKDLQDKIEGLPELITKVQGIVNQNSSKFQRNPEKQHVNDEYEEGDHSHSDHNGYNLTSRMTKLEFPVFDGNDFNDWMCRCRQFMEMDDTPKSMKVKLVAMDLRGKAIHWHQALMKDLNGKSIAWSRYLEEL